VIPGYSVTEDGTKVSDGEIMDRIVEILEEENPAYGYHKLTWRLRRRDHLIINKKKVYRLCREMELLWPQRQRKTRHPRRLPRNWVITRPNQLWETDLKYGYIVGEDRFFYLQSIIDVCDRSIIAYHMGLTCKARDAVQTLQQAVMIRKTPGQEPPVIRTDNGPQFIAGVFEEACAALSLEHERIPVHSPNYNAYIESWHAQLERECLAGYEFLTYAEAYAVVSQWITHYNTVRPHGRLHYWAPEQMRQRVARGQDQWVPLKV
jgi:transposase InsO family protein